MVSIANVGGTDTFGTWITKSNQSFNELTLLTGVTGTTSTKSITGIANNLTVTGDSLFSGVHNLSNTTVTLPVVGNLTIPGGSSGYQLTTDGAGTISWAIPGGSTPSFTTTTGVIANTQFPGTLGLSSNTYFTGANNTFASASVTLGAVGNVHITGGTTGFPLKTDGSGTLSWGTLGNTALASGAVDAAAIAAGAVGNTEIATAAVTNTHIKAAAVGNTEIAANAVDSAHTKDSYIPGYTEVVMEANDSLIFADNTDSNNTKRDTVQGLLDLFDSPIGQHTIWMPAGAMEAAVTTAAATSNAVEVGTSLFAARTMDFETGSDNYAYFGIQMPKSWDAGALVCQFVWSATGATANTVLWGLSAISLADDEVLTTAFGAPTTQVDTNSTTADDIMVSPEVSVTVGSTPAAEDYLMFEVMRDVSGDNLAEDARLHGIKIHYTTDTGSDS